VLALEAVAIRPKVSWLRVIRSWLGACPGGHGLLLWLGVRCVEETMAQSSCDFKSFHGPPAQLVLLMGHQGPTGKVRPFRRFGQKTPCSSLDPIRKACWPTSVFASPSHTSVGPPGCGFAEIAGPHPPVFAGLRCPVRKPLHVPSCFSDKANRPVRQSVGRLYTWPGFIPRASVLRLELFPCVATSRNAMSSV
jgi:hypothetical protein